MESIVAQGQLVVYAAYLLGFLATFVVARMLLHEEESRAAQENLADLGDRKNRAFLVRVARPFFDYVVPMIRGSKFWDPRRKYYKRKIVAAGLKEQLLPDEFIAFKFFLILFFPFVGALLKAFEFIDLEWYMIFGSGIAGWFYPDFWMKSRLQLRQKQILKALPFIVDLLALSMEAGLDFIGAISKVVEKAKPSPLVEEFAQLLKEIKVGSSRQEALREMALRVDMLELNSFVSILISADQMGASIGKILRQQSEQIRSERMVRAEKEGAKAATKLMIPTVLIVLPAVFLLVIGPFILTLLSGGGL